MVIDLRRQEEADRDFLRLLYRSFRWEELAGVPGWDDAGKIAFLDQQFALQYHHYATHYADSDFRIVTEDDAPIGRLAIDRSASDEIRIVDIGFLPERRGSGLGTQLLRTILDEARDSGKRVTIHVEQFNPAQTLYRRLGFVAVEERGPYWFMEWRSPEPDQAKTA
jgi:ribosomal protein S18 acetylase RimI-like enzyme